MLFVGPAGRRTALERAALHVPDLRLDACVVHNFLALRHALHGNKAPPPLAQLEALVALHGIQKHIVANARVSHDETLERVCDGTDVAGVRAHATSAAQARAADPEEVAAAARAEADDAPEMRTFGALAAPAQSMGQVLAAIATAVSPDNPAMAAAQAANASEHAPAGAPAGAKPCTQQRGETPRDDYGGAAAALYDTFWPPFPLRRGITPGRAVDARQTQHMLLYFDNRFSQTLPLVFTLADMRLRHAVNLTVSTRVRTDPGAFDTFVALVNDQQFATNLKIARRKPDGPGARAVVAQAMQFIDLAGSSVPFSTRQRGHGDRPRSRRRSRRRTDRGVAAVRALPLAPRLPERYACPPPSAWPSTHRRPSPRTRSATSTWSCTGRRPSPLPHAETAKTPQSLKPGRQASVPRASTPCSHCPAYGKTAPRPPAGSPAPGQRPLIKTKSMMGIFDFRPSALVRRRERATVGGDGGDACAAGGAGGSDCGADVLAR